MIQQVIFSWNREGTRLWVLWDNDRRDSFTTMAFESSYHLFHHIASMANEWAKTYDVDIQSVEVKNPQADHQAWLIDWYPISVTNPNGRCITLS